MTLAGAVSLGRWGSEPKSRGAEARMEAEVFPECFI